MNEVIAMESRGHHRGMAITTNDQQPSRNDELFRLSPPDLARLYAGESDVQEARAEHRLSPPVELTTMPKRLAPFLLLLLIFCASAAQAQTGDAAAGAQKAWLCAGCHGVPGSRNAYPVYHVPKLGGQHAQYLIAALKEYKEKQRAHPTMQAIAASLSDQDIADLAAFFSGTAPAPNQ